VPHMPPVSGEDGSLEASDHASQHRQRAELPAFGFGALPGCWIGLAHMPARTLDPTRQRFYEEFGLRPHEPVSDTSPTQWRQLTQAVERATSRQRAELEVALVHQVGQLPCNALVASGLVSSDDMAREIRHGMYDAELAALNLSPL